MGMYVHQPIGGARNCDEYDTGALHTREHNKSQNASDRQKDQSELPKRQHKNKNNQFTTVSNLIFF